MENKYTVISTVSQSKTVLWHCYHDE